MSTSHQSSSSRTVRVFLSSTFRDFSEERNLLVRKIFPELRRRCRERQVELVDVDLRWGITEEEAKQGKVLPICLAEIDRSRPYFMGFIGDRYGWVPEHHQYDLSLLVEQPWLEDHRGGKSVTELEMLHGVLNNPEMKNRAFFYFRDAKYSEAKGGLYLSEGPADKAKLEELKDRIRSSGFPVVENYPDPEALAEKVRDDLWKLIDEAYPVNEIPDPLTLERRRHEAYAASRRRLYLGGEHYFRALDDAMEAVTSHPVLITGASGGGKSALLANWTARWSESHPDTEVILHHLGCGADAADPLKLAVRLMQEIARITGEDFQPESDPEKQLGKLPEWLAKGSAWSERTGKGILLVLDGLDKVSDRTHLRWFPSFLPQGIRMVASCLDGEILQAAKDRLPWSELRVEPLTDEGKRTLITKYLHELYRKSLTSDQIDRIIAHPLSGNPLFLKALLEELRIFGVFELLEARLEDYLSATTIDGLFAKVFARVEEDNSPEDVRAVMEILWGSLESFAEDELIGEHSVTGLAPVKWAPILIALDESLVSEHGRIALGHDYFRKAVEDRYLPTEEDKRRVLKKLSDFCAKAMESEGRKGNSHYVRRQAVRQFLQAADWDRAADALSDLDYVEARARNSELLSLLMDYSLAEKSLPEGEAEKKLEEERQAELDRWAIEITEYSKTWTNPDGAKDLQGGAYPQIPSTVERWSDEKIVKEGEKIRVNPSRLNRVRDFKYFVAINAGVLDKFAGIDGFIVQHAYNSNPQGAVHQSALDQLGKIYSPLILRNWSENDQYNPFPACIRIIEGHRNIVSCISISENARFAITGDWAKIVKVWDLEKGVLIHTLRGHSGRIDSVSISADGHFGVSVGSDNLMIHWDLLTGESLRTITVESGVICMSADGNIVISGSTDIKVWDLRNGEHLGTVNGHTGRIVSLWLSADANIAVSGGSDNTIRMWDLKTLKCIKIINECHRSSVAAMSVSKDARRAVSGSWDNVKAWNLESGECMFDYTYKMPSRDCELTSLSISADGMRAVSSSHDKTIRVWDLKKGACIQIMKGHSRPINSVCVSANGCRAYSVGRDLSIRIWDLEKGISINNSEGHADSIRSLSISDDNQYAVSSTESDEIAFAGDRTLRFWDLKKCKSVKVDNHSSKNPARITCVSISGDGKRGIACMSGDSIYELDLENGVSAKNIYVKDAAKLSLTKKWDKILVLGRGIIKKVKILDYASSECILKFNSGISAKISQEGDYALIVGDDTKYDRQNIQIWNLETEECENVCKGHTDYVGPIDICVSASRVISGSIDGTVRVWDLKSAHCLNVINEYRVADEIVIIGKGKFGLSANFYNDKTLRLLDLDKGKCLDIMHEASMTSMTCNGSFIAVGCTDGSIKTYRIDNVNIS